MIWALQVPGYWLALLLLAPVALLLGAVATRRANARTARLLGERGDELCGAPAFVRTRALAAALACACFVLALLRPVTPGRDAELQPDVVLCVDVSRSMQATDGAPTRFDAMVAQVEALLDTAVGSRFALVAFAGDAQLVAPLTADRAAVRWLLQELRPGAVVARAGTDLSKPLQLAAQLLDSAHTVGEVVLLSDGEEQQGDGAAVAQALRVAGHRVQSIGYGSEAGSKIVVTRGDEQSFLQDERGVDVITRLEAHGLRAIAAAGGGSYAHAGDEAQLAERWRDDWLPRAASRRMRADEHAVAQRFAWPLFAGLLLWMLRMCLPERRR